MNPLYVRAFEKLLARQTEEGSRQLVWAAVGTPDVDDGSLNKLRGAYINLSKIEEPSDFVLGEEGKKREEKLWVSLVALVQIFAILNWRLWVRRISSLSLREWIRVSSILIRDLRLLLTTEGPRSDIERSS